MIEAHLLDNHTCDVVYKSLITILLHIRKTINYKAFCEAQPHMEGHICPEGQTSWEGGYDVLVSRGQIRHVQEGKCDALGKVDATRFGG
jgi:hypothetical protein